MFLKIRTRRANKEKSSKRGIFRKTTHQSKDESPAPEIEQVLTMTLSEDVSDTCSDIHDIAHEQPHVVSFTQQQAMENTFKQVRQQQEIQAKEQQVAEMKAAMTRKLAEKEHLLIELKHTHSLKMTAKQEEIIKMKNVLHELKQNYEEKLSSKQVELDGVKAESDTKLA